MSDKHHHEHHEHHEAPKEEPYYVGVTNAVELRRAVLETAREVVETIQTHKRIREVEEEKLRLRGQLAHIAVKLREDLKTLESKLPHKSLPAIAPPSVHHKPIDHKLDKIEAALMEIEERMKSL